MKTARVALRATFIVDPDNVIQHVSVNNLNVGRNPDEVRRLLDGLQTDEPCPCNHAVGGATLYIRSWNGSPCKIRKRELSLNQWGQHRTLRRHLFDFALDPVLQFRFGDFQIVAQLQVQP